MPHLHKSAKNHYPLHPKEQTESPGSYANLSNNTLINCKVLTLNTSVSGFWGQCHWHRRLKSEDPKSTPYLSRGESISRRDCTRKKICRWGRGKVILPCQAKEPGLSSVHTGTLLPKEESWWMGGKGTSPWEQVWSKRGFGVDHSLPVSSRNSHHSPEHRISNWNVGF